MLTVCMCFMAVAISFATDDNTCAAKRKLLSDDAGDKDPSAEALADWMKFFKLDVDKKIEKKAEKRSKTMSKEDYVKQRVERTNKRSFDGFCAEQLKELDGAWKTARKKAKTPEAAEILEAIRKQMNVARKDKALKELCTEDLESELHILLKADLDKSMKTSAKDGKHSKKHIARVWAEGILKNMDFCIFSKEQLEKLEEAWKAACKKANTSEVAEILEAYRKRMNMARKDKGLKELSVAKKSDDKPVKKSAFPNWAIAVIVISCLAVIGGGIGTFCYYRKRN